MATFIGVARTNHFRVTDEARYSELFSHLSGESDVVDFTKEIEGVTYHAFGSYSPIDYVEGDGGCEEGGIDGFLDEIRKILPEDEAFMYFMVGNEKLCYVDGMAFVCTRNEVVFHDLDSWAKKKAKMILGESFRTETGF